MIASGFAIRDVWNLTPKQIAAYLFLAEKRKLVELHEKLSLLTLAQSGDKNTIKKVLEDWEKEL